MSELGSTLLITFCFILLAMMGLGIGWLVRGKARLHSCKFDPTTSSEECKKKLYCPICKPDNDI